jgi:hypothetical protein
LHQPGIAPAPAPVRLQIGEAAVAEIVQALGVLPLRHLASLAVQSIPDVSINSAHLSVVIAGPVPAFCVIASEAKQSSAEAPHWIASSLRSSQ